jgi:tetratricopeptide (TPR) repeat protein
VAIPPLNRIVGDWEALWYQDWPVRIALHVAFTFIAPTAVLGTLSPVCAKMALDQGRAAGRTIGNIYAWGAIGSIVGTFVTGFYLIPRLGAVEVIWVVGAILAILGLGLAARSVAAYLWVAAFVALAWAGLGQSAAARTLGVHLRSMILDQLLHSAFLRNRPHELFYPYEHLYAAVTRANLPGDRPLRVLMIGGGGYSYPMYMERTYPGSHVEAVEIDPLVTEAAHQTFNLPRDTPIRIHHMDGRNFVETLARRQREGRGFQPFDFIYADAVNSFSVPFHLTTREYHAIVRNLLAPDGAYLMTMIDTYASARFLGALYNTVADVFEHVVVFCGSPSGPNPSPKTRDTFILVGSRRPLRLDQLVEPSRRPLFSRLTEANLEHVRQRSGGMVLTDNFAPVEQLLADVVRNAADPGLEFVERGLRERDAGNIDKAVDYLAKAVRHNIYSAVSHGEYAQTLRRYKDPAKQKIAAEHLEAATRLDSASPDWWQAYGTLLLEMKRYAEAVQRFQKAVELRPDDADAWVNLSFALLSVERFEEAAGAAGRAAELAPQNASAWYNLMTALVRLGRFHEAIPLLRKLVDSNPARHDLANELAWLLAVAAPPDLRDPQAAVRYAEQANGAVERPLASYLDTLGAAYAAAGQFDRAVAAARRAVELYPSQGQDPAIARELRDRLSSYEQGRPYFAPGTPSR